jgi:hypothetical protein
MKRVFILGLGVALVAGGITSCGKTTKGKMANEWSVAGFSSEDKTIYADLSQNTRTVEFDGTELKTVSVSVPNGGSSSSSEWTGTVNDWTYTIGKDGSWSSSKDVTTASIDSVFDFFTGDFIAAYTVTNNVLEENTGVWNFIGKTKIEEFKKNERLLFNALTSNYKTTYTYEGEPAEVTTDNYTHSAGDATMVYTVVESKSKELQLKSDSEYSNVDLNGTYTSTFMSTLSLSQR